MTNATADAYDAVGAAYRDWWWSGLWDTYEKDLVYQELPMTGRILDAGCGYGRYADLVTEHGLEYVGIDVSNVQLAVARATHPALGSQLFVGDLVAMPFPDETFDLVVCTRVLNHGVALDAMAQEFARVLRPDGRVVITDIAELHQYARATIPTDAGRVTLPLKRYRRKALVASLQGSSFCIDETHSINEGDDGRALLDITTARKIA